MAKLSDEKTSNIWDDTSQIELTDRIYLQLVPDDSDVAPIVHIQGYLRKQGIIGNFADPSRFHITVIHFGDLQQSYDEMKQWSPTLTEKLFLEHITKLVDQFEKLTPFRSPVTLKELTVYGASGGTIAVRIDIDERVREFYRQAFEHLKSFFADCGVEYVDAFMKGSIHFRHASVFSPHISLISSTRKGAPLSLPVVMQHDIQVFSSPIIHKNI